ncbi:DUF2637 domain-containing protein, partial [Streptomyces monashensis]|uniref:DUF2637 domain-containing protein n=1 Tax=Streptomyces monashensis TaxID=1678012 RepID=UPI0033D94A83
AVEAARHAVGRIADITADKHMEGVRITRWLLSPVPTFLLWRRMKLWELRSYDQVIKLEQERLVYQARLHSRFGRGWRRKAPVESLMPLRLARYGVPLTETAPAGLAAAGIEPVLLPPVPQQPQLPAAAVAPAERPTGPAPVPRQAAAPQGEQRPGPPAEGDDQSPWFQAQQQAEYHGGYDPAYAPAPEPRYVPEEEYGPWYEEQQTEDFQQPSAEETGSFPIPVGPNRTRELGDGGGIPEPQPTEEDFYLVFRKSIDGSYPTGAQFKDDVEATFGIALAANDANRMVNRFTNRHTAELEEDHIA